MRCTGKVPVAPYDGDFTWPHTFMQIIFLFSFFTYGIYTLN